MKCATKFCTNPIKLVSKPSDISTTTGHSAQHIARPDFNSKSGHHIQTPTSFDLDWLMEMSLFKEEDNKYISINNSLALESSFIQTALSRVTRFRVIFVTRDSSKKVTKETKSGHSSTDSIQSEWEQDKIFLINNHTKEINTKVLG